MTQLLLFCFVFFISSVSLFSLDSKHQGNLNPRFIHDWNEIVIEINIDDGFLPPVAARNHAYTNIAAFEAGRHLNPSKFQSFEKKLNGLSGIPKPQKNGKYHFQLASSYAFHTVAKALMYRTTSCDSLLKAQHEYVESLKDGSDIELSKSYGIAVGKHILQWARKDNYVEMLAKKDFEWPKGPGNWEPTPPNFMEPVLPYLSTMRTLVIKEPTSFKPAPPIPFSTDKNSEFYKQMMEVYDISKTVDAEKKLIAWYWNCLPVSNKWDGHRMYNQRQMNPGGHWIAITRIVAKEQDIDFLSSSLAYCAVSCSQFDGFLSCWAEKYRSNTIRPISYIKKYIDPKWEGVLETPSFPEHTSAHSTISSSNAEVLTALFGSIPFTDTSEMPFGLPSRSFKSFMDAAEEVSMSRMYGGIHLTHGCEEGQKVGHQIGKFIVKKLNIKKVN
ncbi:MAG: vanadium-dependent haloperoxidase [Candidatus Kapabacteria bacterium]|nr:vanadium-dependent haloperoxidase [Candidatus Kapabacteria bacterium]